MTSGALSRKWLLRLIQTARELQEHRSDTRESYCESSPQIAEWQPDLLD